MRTYLKRAFPASLLAGILGVSALYGAEGINVGDTYVNQTSSSNNYGNLGTMNVGGGNTSLVQFSLAGVLPTGTSGAQIQHATLILFANRVGAPGTINLYTLGGPWSEATLTYATLPALVGPSGSVMLSQNSQYVLFDVTSLVQGWVNTPASNNGFALVGDPSTPSVAVLFDTKESTTSSHPAALEITLTSSGPAGATGATGTSGPAGATGPTGAQGTSGVAGATGTPGPAGATGPTGAQGTSGVAGATGAQGPAGAAGPMGTQGNAGAVGTQGPSGATGPKGATGVTGPPGSTGPLGPQGPQGVAGTNGSNGAPGPQGPAGANGNGLILKDANSNSLGFLLGNSGTGYNTYKAGYFFTIVADGTFVTAQIRWTGANCTGTPYLNDGGSPPKLRLAKSVIYSKMTDTLYTMSSPNAFGTSSSVAIAGGTMSIENPTCMAGVSATASGWALTPASDATLGIITTSNPKKVAAPLILP